MKIPVGNPAVFKPGNTEYPVHFIAEGDNLRILRQMKEQWTGRFDFVYIDPPYNTGKKQNRKYNDRFWDHYSREKHKKWLVFMRERLEALMPLLSERAVVFVSIDDRELPHLILLLRELFGEWNTEVLIWHKIPGEGHAGQGKMKRAKRFRIDHEYIVAAYKNKDALRFNKVRSPNPVRKHYGNPDNDPRGPWISAEICKSAKKSNPNGKNFYTIITPGGRKITRQWHVSEEEFRRLDQEGRIWWGNGRIIPRLKKFLNEPRLVTPSSVIENISQSEGVKDLARLSGQADFKHPKPVRLIKHLLEMAAPPGARILDFFAGTGSTGQAVLEMNAREAKNFRFVLVSNNEDDTLHQVLLPRLWKARQELKLPDELYFIPEKTNP